MKFNAPSGERAMTALLTPTPDKWEELLQTLRGLVAEIRSQEGCLDCLVGMDIAGSQRFLLMITWSDGQTQQKGMASEPFRILLGASSTLTSTGRITFADVDPPYLGPGPPNRGLAVR